MLERETEIILETLAQRTIGAKDSITLRDAVLADLPRGVRKYLEAEVSSLFAQDLSSAPHFDRIDHNLPGIDTTNRAFLRSLTHAYRFPRREFLTVLEHAVLFVENYVCRPRWTLNSFIYASDEHVTLDALLARFDYIAEYSYLPTLIERVVRQRGWKTISASEFTALVERIDDAVVRQHSGRELGLLTRPIFDFLYLGQGEPALPIPVEPLLLFFQDKRLTILGDYIEKVCHIRNQQQLTLDELISLIEDLHSGAPGGSLTDTGTPGADEESQREAATAQSQGAGEQSPEAIAEGGEKEAEAADHPPGGNHVPPAIRDRKNIALSLTFAGMQESQARADLPDLGTLISEDQRNRFIRRVFAKDPAYYGVVIEALNQTTTWKEASLYLKQFYELNGLDPFSRDIVEFTDAVQARFTSESGDSA